MFGQRKQKKYRRSNTLKVDKPVTRSRLDKVIDILEAAAKKDDRPSYKKNNKVKYKSKSKPYKSSGWDASINW